MKPYYEHAGITIYHGDCREVAPTLAYDAIVSDPPYGMAYDTNGARFTLGGRSFAPVYGDDAEFDPAWMLTPQWCVLWGFNHFPSGLRSGGCLMWIKRSDAAFGQFLSDGEVAWHKQGRGVYAYRDIRHAIAEKREHPTEKPVGLMSWSIQRSGAPAGAVILDPYLGAGTTLIAAKQTGYRAIGIEIEERYCEIAARRLAQEVLPLEVA